MLRVNNGESNKIEEDYPFASTTSWLTDTHTKITMQ
jgi:hypothetical protein